MHAAPAAPPKLSRLQVPVCVIDTGARRTHQDLAANIRGGWNRRAGLGAMRRAEAYGASLERAQRRAASVYAVPKTLPLLLLLRLQGRGRQWQPAQAGQRRLQQLLG